MLGLGPLAKTSYFLHFASSASTNSSNMPTPAGPPIVIAPSPSLSQIVVSHAQLNIPGSVTGYPPKKGIKIVRASSADAVEYRAVELLN